MEIYKHKVQYYETDKMGITHHSNYIRWMEEARISFLDKMGWGFDKLEAEGIISPVASVEAKYKKTTTFPEVVFIEVTIEEFKGVKLKLNYKMTNENGEEVCLGHSEHAFINSEGRIISLKREVPELFELLTQMVEK